MATEAAKTPKVHALDETVIRQIAAGEVVERPASVLKELLENALDAKSRHVTIDLQGAGRELIRVADDGHGMASADAALALERHTTSKIRSFDDLESLSTFGFRGEALPSIASVSKLELVTHSADEPHGFCVSVSGGKIVSKKECGRAYGTTVEVRDLFHNTPARLKFLKSDATERARLLRVFEETALAHPGVAFEYRDAARQRPLELPARKSLLERISDLWGSEFGSETLFPLSLDHPYLKIEGWVSQPQAHQAGKSYQVFYVNRRPIQSRSLTHALYEAYRDCLPVGRHPAAVVFLSLDASQVDVNVHPAKREVRFRNESQVYEALVREIRLKRTEGSSAPRMFSDAPERVPPPAQRVAEPRPSYTAQPPQVFPELQKTVQAALPAAAPMELPSPAAPRPPRVLAQLHALYILAEDDQGLVLVDQHAASERILYERLKKAALSDETVPAQPLLLPVLWSLNRAEAEIVEGQLGTFGKLGYRIEPFGERTFRVAEAPAIIPEPELKDTLDAILRSLEDRGTALAADEKILMMSACRAAVKANDRLSVKELSELVQHLSTCDNPHTCPHGRPTTVRITRLELDKKFGRI